MPLSMLPLSMDSLNFPTPPIKKPVNNYGVENKQYSEAMMLKDDTLETIPCNLTLQASKPLVEFFLQISHHPCVKGTIKWLLPANSTN